MVARTLLVVLVAACSVHSLNAWPWDRKTTTTTTTTTLPPAPAVMSREKFLARLSQAAQSVTGEVAKSHQLVQEADAADKVGQAITKATADVSEYTKWYTNKLNEYADNMIEKTVDVAPCVATYMEDKAWVEAYSVVGSKVLIHADMQDVRDTAVKADALLEKIAAVKARGEAEAAKPDGEYGGDVDAILKDADDVVAKAVWNNTHINAVVYDLRFAADVTITRSYAPEDMRATQDYGQMCMRRASMSQQ